MIETECPVCRRRISGGVATPPSDHLPCKQKVEGGKVRYYHTGYGCDTGCCGHAIVIDNKHGDEVYYEFEFCHKKEDLDYSVAEVAERLGITVGECEFNENC